MSFVGLRAPVLVAIVLAVGLLALEARPAHAATFVVNTTGDQADASGGTGSCDVDTGSSGDQCTLRAAIQSANNDAGADVINFNIGFGPRTITVASSLPSVIYPVLIDGLTQRSGSQMFSIPCYLPEQNPCIEVSGNNLVAADGLRIANAGSATIRGLVVNRFGGDGIEILSSNNTVQYTFIGTNMNGDAALPNGASFANSGIKISTGSNNVIGGTTGFTPTLPTLPTANLISGNNAYGVTITGATSTANSVLGNRIGTNLAATGSLPNTQGGVLLDEAASGNTVGGTTDTTPGGACTGACNVISGNGAAGIEVLDSATGNTVAGNFIGTSPSGTSPLGNTNGGIFISRAGANTIGGMTASARNLISGNSGSGISLFGSDTTANVIAGNYIGADTTGAAGLGNDDDGITIEDSDGTIIGGTVGTTPGGACTGACNVISGNAGGITLFVDDPEAITDTVIQGNYIGTNATGTVGLNGLGDGITLAATNGGAITGTMIGGTTPAARNLISGNASDGITIRGAGTSSNTVSGNYVGTNSPGSGPLANPQSTGIVVQEGAHDNTVGGTLNTSPGGACTGACNLISGNGAGIEIVGQGSSGNVVAGNYIGTNATGDAGVANGNAISILGAPGNTIGGETPAARNLITNNQGYGVYITDDGLSNADGNAILGNYIGVLTDGASPLGNSSLGVYLWATEAPFTVNGTLVRSNVISANGGLGVGLESTDAGVVDSTVIAANFIGTDATGQVGLGNSGAGLELLSGNPGEPVSNTVVGGPDPADGNVISGNTGSGIVIRGADSADNVVQNNKVGVAADGQTPLGNGLFGVRLGEMAHDNAIGTPRDGNIIGDNQAGVRIGDAGTTANLVQGNFIGTNDPGDDLGNDAEGVYITSEGNTVGGPNAGEENVIKFNGADGVRVEGNDGFGNAILRNSIDENVELGINLVNNGNGTAAPPNLTSAENGSTHITGVFVGEPSTEYHFEFFASPACDDSGAGEGEQWIGSSGGQTAPSGVLNINADFGTTTPAGLVITATATDPDGNTSEFSNCVTVTGDATPTPTITPTDTGNTPTPTGTLAPTPTGSATPVHGDADCDGDADLDDMLAVLAFEAGVGGEPPCAEQADADCDGDIDAQEALLIALYVAEVPAAATPPCPPVGA